MQSYLKFNLSNDMNNSRQKDKKTSSVSKFTKCTKQADHFEQIAIRWLFSANVSLKYTHLQLVNLLIQITQQKLFMQ